MTRIPNWLIIIYLFTCQFKFKFKEEVVLFTQNNTTIISL